MSCLALAGPRTGIFLAGGSQFQAPGRGRAPSRNPRSIRGTRVYGSGSSAGSKGYGARGAMGARAVAVSICALRGREPRVGWAGKQKTYEIPRTGGQPR